MCNSHELLKICEVIHPPLGWSHKSGTPGDENETKCNLRL